MSLPGYCLNGALHANGAPSSSSFMPGFIPPPSSSNPQMFQHLPPRAFSSSPNFPTGTNSRRRNGQLGATGTALREPSGAYAVRQFHPANRQHSLQQRLPPQQKASSSSSTVTSERYKTELCRPFEESGTCRYGHKCQFAHGSRELRTLSRHPKYKTEPCRTFHSSGFCPYGTRCHFIHNGSGRQIVPSESPSESSSGEPCSADDFNRESEPGSQTPEPGPQTPEPGSQTVSSVNSSGLPSGQDQPLEAPPLLNYQKLSSGMILPLSYPAATIPATCCIAVASGSVAASAAAMFSLSGGVPYNTCANNTQVFGQGLGGYVVPVAFQPHNFANANATAYCRSQQQGLVAPTQFPMPAVAPPATILSPSALAPMAAAVLVTPGTATATTVAPAATVAANTTSATGPVPHLGPQPPDAQSETLEIDMLISSLDSLLGTNSFDSLLSYSSSSSLSGSAAPRTNPSRRLPIFSRLSDSDK